MKILEQQISIQNLLVVEKSIIYREMCADFQVFVLQRLVPLVSRLIDIIQTYVNCE